MKFDIRFGLARKRSRKNPYGDRKYFVLREIAPSLFKGYSKRMTKKLAKKLYHQEIKNPKYLSVIVYRNTVEVLKFVP